MYLPHPNPHRYQGHGWADHNAGYAEAAFYDLSFSEEKETVDFNADTADAPMRYALEGTGWSVERSRHHSAHMAVYGEKRPFHPAGHAEYPRRGPDF